MRVINRPWATLLAILLFVIPFTNTLPAHADATGPGTLVTGGCLEDVSGFGLSCTANDVRVSGVADANEDGIVDEGDITFAPICDATAQNKGLDCSTNPGVCLNGDGISDPSLCGDRCAFPGDTTTFSATFIFELSAQARFDVGAYFEVTPDLAGDGALTGSCDIITLPEDDSLFTRFDGTTGNFVDLDTGCKGGGCPQPGDLCGDINAENNPIYYDMKGAKSAPDQITMLCADTDGDGQLNMPNCTSWRQSGANEMCTNGLQAFAGAPSKCNCNPNFQVPIDVPAATITVDKTASPTLINEPGSLVQFSAKVTNDSPFATVTITSLMDDMYGDITQVHGDISSTNCFVPFDLGPGETGPGDLDTGVTGPGPCTFMAMVSGQGDTSHTDTITAVGIDENDNVLTDSDSATVAIANVEFDFTVVKSVAPGSLPEPGGDFTFTVVVANTSAVDDLTMTALVDDIYGDLHGVGGVDGCSVPQTILQGGSYSCSFTVNEIQSPGFMQTDIIEATATDEEGPSVKKSDTAMIQITDVPSTITLVKTASPTAFNEPSADVTYTYMITNDATVDTVTISVLTDDILGNLNGMGDCLVPQNLAPNGGNYSCSVTVEVSGNAGDVVTNVATASGQDDDGGPVSDMDNATVNIDDVPPAASLTKVPTMTVVTYDVTVTNDSTAEGLSLDMLDDDLFGDITDIQGNVQSTDCAVPQLIPVGGNYKCTFVGKVNTSPHTNTVTGTVSDDEGTEVTPSDSATVTFTSNP